MRRIHPSPLTAAAFAPFGDVLEAPSEPGRRYFDRGLGNDRAHAKASLSLARVAPLSEQPLIARQMERHAHSSQSFVPLGAARWLVIVAPHGAGARPDVAAAQAFVVGPGQGITYRADVWHHPLTVLDAEAAFAILMWRDGSRDDEEFLGIEPFAVATD